MKSEYHLVESQYHLSKSDYCFVESKYRLVESDSLIKFEYRFNLNQITSGDDVIRTFTNLRNEKHSKTKNLSLIFIGRNLELSLNFPFKIVYLLKLVMRLSWRL